MKRFLFLFAFLLTSFFAHATHNIAGEITAKVVLDASGNCVNYLTYKVTVTTYTNTQSPADRCELTIEWGDGVSTILPRINGQTNGNCQPAGMGVDLTSAGYPSTKVNIYEGVHTYPGPSGPQGYTIKVKDPNRVAGISNIPNSVNVPFYLQTTLFIDPLIGCNSSPILTIIPLDKACRGQCFYHNPGAVDPDGDSLSFRLGPCLDTNGLPVPGYTFPNVNGGGNLTLNPSTGDLEWCSPQVAGKYNVVIYIDEWRRFPNGVLPIGTVLRDMSIDVINSCDNENPIIDDLQDLCVDAGTLVAFPVNVDDPDNGDEVKLQGYGGPFNTTPSASLSPVNLYLPIPYTANFSWQTNCEHVRLQPWPVTFKATDNDSPNSPSQQVPLTDIETVNITVVSPGPAFLNVTPQASTMNLAWGVNPCDPLNNFCMGYRIYRRQGPSGWNPGPCETGVPAYTGFVLIGTTTGINSTTFVDNNAGAGLIPGVDYCYRVCAYFIDGAQSYASPEACSELLRDVPVITHVDVLSTGTNDSIYVGWVNPLANGVDFDTILKPGPYKMELERSPGFIFNSTTATLVNTFIVSSFYQLPVNYFDSGLNTLDSAYTYRLNFYHSTDSLEGNCQPASSVYISTTPADNSITLSWQYNVPWTNFEFNICRFNTVSNSWDTIGTTTSQSYLDDSLVNGVDYCYFVDAHGSYFNALLPPIMHNRSQEKCAMPVDMTAPCAPVLIVNSDCFIGLNQLAWTNPNNMNCGTDDVVSYQVWFSPNEIDPLQLIATVSLSTDTVIVFSGLLSVAGCYAITAVDTFNNVSPMSNIVCVDNCPTYVLPNVFTPNGDNVNDFFVPFPYRFVKDIDLKIYDRWGVLVFQTTDPDIRWNGRDMNSGKLCTDGVYYYACTVNEILLEGIVPRELKGFVHLFGKDVGQPQ
ncbi:MAG TPA: gliding motility-associated C-terminal domain-containing protein [Bacteroidia bacterium]|nr:gliding motility-associated C-terminal domain-containing protein [Bacteroidia bacterium]